MLTRRAVTHQYGFAGYYTEPYHVLMLSDAYPPGEGTRGGMARYYQAPLNSAVTLAGGSNFKPYLGMDPSDPGTWPRPYNPSQGMFSRLHEDQAAAAGNSDGGRKRRRR